MKSLICNDSTSFNEDPIKKLHSLSVSERLVRSFSEKLNKNSKKTKKRNDLGGLLNEERSNEMQMMKPVSSSNCISVYIKGGGGCSRVGSCDETDRIIEKKLSRKLKAGGESLNCAPKFLFPLPDDVLELVLVRLPLRALVVARLVCKKWSRMVVSPQFMQLRLEGYGRNPWLFLFGLSRKGVHVGEVFGLDVVENRWNVMRSDLLKDRFMFSVERVGMDVYIVGGCSEVETHKGVLVFSPLNNSWRQVSPMKVARSQPVLGVFEVGSNCNIFSARQSPLDQNQTRVRLKTRVGGVSDVYEDPHRFSLRRQLGDAINESTSVIDTKRRRGRSKQPPKFAFIVVGGIGSSQEPLNSGEIYDPSTNSWIEIARLPEYFGSVCSGAVCNGKFYVFSSISNKLASYDLERGLWVVVQTSHFPPRIRDYNPKLVSCKNRLFMSCVCWWERDEGAVIHWREKAVRKLWELDLTVLHSWAEVCTHPDAPMDKNATFVADDDDDKLYGLEMFRVFGQVLDFVTACQVSDTEMEWHRVSRNHAGHEACAGSCMAKAMVVMHL